jgi:DNA repair protein RecO (recombination protein O)
MLEKTRGIILHQIKYTDSGVVTHAYTRKFGRQSFLIRGMRNKKTGKHSILVQPLFVLDLVFYYKPSHDIQSMKEFSVSSTPYDIYSNIKKSAVALFLGEVLYSVLREESANEELFDYVEKAIMYFEESNDHFANFHIAFLAGLSSYLGFEPNIRSDSRDKYFDMQNGSFVQLPPVHGDYADEEVSDILADFFSSSYDSTKEISLTGKARNQVLETLIRYYSLHLPGLKKIKSLEVLKTIFSQDLSD